MALRTHLTLFLGLILLLGPVSIMNARPQQQLPERHTPKVKATLADDVAAAEEALRTARSALIASKDMAAADYVNRLIDLGLWQEAHAFLQNQQAKSAELLLAEGWLLFKTHRYAKAEALVDALLKQGSNRRGVRLLQAHLQIQAWNLEKAAATTEALLRSGFDEEAALILGRIRLLERQYEEAMKWARRVQAAFPDNSDAHLLEADVFFWQRDLSSAEPALVRALERDPFNADARFAYGYAIWRRVDATLLENMAAQWNLGLALDPLNYRIHWHLGNGHTNLTYADYVHPTDSTVRPLLQEVDSLLAVDEVGYAIARTRDIERSYPESILPAMMRGSAFFMAYDMDRESRLDSAQYHFLDVLARKKNYGPAHNGVAAVIKHRQFSQLNAFSALDRGIESTPVMEAANFAEVFPDARYYPGDRVEKMLYRQLHKGIVFLPFLVRLQRTFTIPPLHVDLAEAMDAPYFRYATTFDNRQWMDIRGVGSGAAGIEYVERGAYLERNVVLHEYVHLFHGQILTDEENRLIRALYLAAMQEDRVLDYYGANNESEYLAQTYTAYFAPVKVHPLNHKSMNTRQDLEEKDPVLFRFIDELVARQTAYQEGDTLALAGNWAQVYVTLSEQARNGRGPDAVEDSVAWPGVAAALLDTAFTWHTEYMPAYLSYASLMQDQGQFDEASTWLDRAEALQPTYAPIYRSRAELAGARYKAGALSNAEAFEQQKTWYEKTLEIEEDFAERAYLNAALRELYLRFSHVSQAIEVADRYVEAAPVVSTYLRDRRDEAWVFTNTHRSNLGYAAEVVDEFARLISRKPQQYTFRKHYAGVLSAAGRHRKAIQVLEEAQRILTAANRPRKDYMVRLADLYLQIGDTTKAHTVIAPLYDDGPESELDKLKLIRVFAALGDEETATSRYDSLDTSSTPYVKAESSYTHGVLMEARGSNDDAVQAFEEALQQNPYHVQARLRLVKLYIQAGRRDKASTLAAGLEGLGPAFREEASDVLSNLN